MYQLTQAKIKYLQNKSNQIRKEILNISYHAGVGHIAPALSITDILAVLYHQILKVTPKSIKDPKRNRLILSKGHAAAALYACLYQKKFITHQQLYTYCLDNSLFGVHPDYHPKLGIELTTGSLGHGLSVGVGMALGLKTNQTKSNNTPRVYVLVSDAELNEGSVWEAVMFAGHHKLNNLTLIIDNNGNQAFGKTKEVINLKPLKNKFKMFGWYPQLTNGHDIRSLVESFNAVLNIYNRPQVIIAQTHAGYGISFMKDKIQWHYWPLTENLHKQALADLGKNI